MSFREGRLLETKTDVAVSFGVKDFFVCRCCCCCCRHGRGFFVGKQILGKAKAMVSVFTIETELLVG